MQIGGELAPEYAISPLQRCSVGRTIASPALQSKAS
jgi:hypothetical protein